MSSVLEKPVLVLNRNWHPVQTCSVRRSIHLLCTGHAEVVQVDGDERFQTHDFGSWVRHSQGADRGALVRSSRLAIRVPSVVVLAFYDRVPRMEVRFSRRNVFLRDRFTCQYCEKTLPESQLNLDHVLPRDRGGRTSWENIVTSCFRCNTRKANRLPHEAGMQLHSKPAAPRWRPLFGGHEEDPHDGSWSLFLRGQGGDGLLSA